MSASRGPIDWPAAHARLDELQRALETGGARSPAEVASILARRAATLAMPTPEPTVPGEILELLLLDVARGRYGIETARVREVLALDGLASLPTALAFVLGVLNHRGRILPVFDLAGLLGLVREDGNERALVVAVEAGGMTFGLVADAVIGIAHVSAGELRRPPTMAAAGEPFVLGVTGEMVAVLALEALAHRIVVNDEGG